jgi:hypothetical protein
MLLQLMHILLRRVLVGNTPLFFLEFGPSQSYQPSKYMMIMGIEYICTSSSAHLTVPEFFWDAEWCIWVNFVQLVLLVGAKLQHVIATLTLENTGEGPYAGSKLRPRDELFWFNKPQLVLYLIHFILFQVH